MLYIVNRQIHTDILHFLFWYNIEYIADLPVTNGRKLGILKTDEKVLDEEEEPYVITQENFVNDTYHCNSGTACAGYSGGSFG